MAGARVVAAMVLASTVAGTGCGRIAFQSVTAPDGGDVPPVSEGSVDASSDRSLEVGSDGTVADVATDGGNPSPCASVPDALLCADFDDADLGGFIAMGGVTDLAVEDGWGGTAGYRLTAAPGQNARLQYRPTSPFVSGALHIGGRMFVEAGPMHPSFVVLAQAIGTVDFAKVSYDMEEEDRAQVVNTVASLAAQGDPGSVPRDTWQCFELAIDLDEAGGNGRVRLLIDGVALLDEFAGSDTIPEGGFNVVEVGALSAATNTDPVSVRLDNVIVHTGPIGCPG